MNVVAASIADVLIIEPKVFGDARGFFYESFNQKAFCKATRLDVNFVQDNHSRSAKGVLRGLHYQVAQPQGKLVRVVRGVVFDVSVDIRKTSATFGKWGGVELSEDNQRQVWVPAGFAHGFVVISDQADVIYKTTDYYMPELGRCIAWNDPVLDINWPFSGEPSLSEQDKAGCSWAQVEFF